MLPVEGGGAPATGDDASEDGGSDPSAADASTGDDDAVDAIAE
jgi:hypothetical protein